MTILAIGFADKNFRGTDGLGRVYHTSMGHADYSVECVGFIITPLRGDEWAATGNVTLTNVPYDVPSNQATSTRDFK